MLKENHNTSPATEPKTDSIEEEIPRTPFNSTTVHEYIQDSTDRPRSHSATPRSSIRRSSAIHHHLQRHLTDVKESVNGSDILSLESTGQKEFERKNMWFCCGYEHIDKRMITYIVQVCISFIMLLFCMFKLSEKNGDSDTTIWVSLLSGILGNYLPSAQLK